MPEIEQIAGDIENRLHEIFPNRDLKGEWFGKIVNFAIDDVLETSAIGEGEDYYTDGDVALACERALLHFLGHPNF